MIHRHKSIRSSVRTRPLVPARDRAELLVARCIASGLLRNLSSQMHRAMAVDTAVNRRVRDSKHTSALIWAVTYLDTLEIDDLPVNVREAIVVADVIINYMEQRQCESAM